MYKDEDHDYHYREAHFSAVGELITRRFNLEKGCRQVCKTHFEGPKNNTTVIIDNCNTRLLGVGVEAFMMKDIHKNAVFLTYNDQEKILAHYEFINFDGKSGLQLYQPKQPSCVSVYGVKDTDTSIQDAPCIWHYCMLRAALSATTAADKALFMLDENKQLSDATTSHFALFAVWRRLMATALKNRHQKTDIL
jgi:hypothetical protein